MATTKASNGSTPPEPPLDPDPEIAALLDFEPVVRRNRRHDGWQPEHQRGFIAALARLGNVDRAAHSVGRTASGAWTVRSSAGAEGFAESWDCALDLFHGRNPALSRRGGRARFAPAPPPAPEPPAGADAAEPDEAQEIRTFADMIQPLIDKYLKKLEEERKCRLAGRIVEADYCVRQLTAIEIILDLGGAAQALLLQLRAPNGMELINVVATPMSVLLAGIRRDFWREKGEPERPPLPPLGEHDGVAARGEPISFWSDRDGKYQDWCRRQDQQHALAAEAQQAWEKKAKADAAKWAKRVKRASSPGFPGEGDHPK